MDATVPANGARTVRSALRISSESTAASARRASASAAVAASRPLSRRPRDPHLRPGGVAGRPRLGLAGVVVLGGVQRGLGPVEVRLGDRRPARRPASRAPRPGRSVRWRPRRPPGPGELGLEGSVSSATRTSPAATSSPSATGRRTPSRRLGRQLRGPAWAPRTRRRRPRRSRHRRGVRGAGADCRRPGAGRPPENTPSITATTPTVTTAARPRMTTSRRLVPWSGAGASLIRMRGPLGRWCGPRARRVAGCRRRRARRQR